MTRAVHDGRTVLPETHRADWWDCRVANLPDPRRKALYDWPYDGVYQKAHLRTQPSCWSTLARQGYASQRYLWTRCGDASKGAVLAWSTAQYCLTMGPGAMAVRWMWNPRAQSRWTQLFHGFAAECRYRRWTASSLPV